jgi:hypothetical protein
MSFFPFLRFLRYSEMPYKGTRNGKNEKEKEKDNIGKFCFHNHV